MVSANAESQGRNAEEISKGKVLTLEEVAKKLVFSLKKWLEVL